MRGDGRAAARRQLPPVPVLARTLANELDALDAPFVLVLDDYHRIAPTSGVHELFSRLLEHPPATPAAGSHDPARPAVVAVLATCGEPPDGGAAAGPAVHRAGDRRAPGHGGEVAVGEDALGNLQQEVEGWAVGLRLVSLALRHVVNPSPS